MQNLYLGAYECRDSHAVENLLTPEDTRSALTSETLKITYAVA